jgi:3-deoxy-manno-octulosonate cytidylyltransferase (CMP-KDO synthetase)
MTHPLAQGNLAVIPARYASTRFPGKPLAADTGQPLIQHVVERVRQARLIHHLIVATDDERIFDAVQAFGAQAMMTRSDHPNGTSRIAEVVARILPHPAPDLPACPSLPGVVINAGPGTPSPARPPCPSLPGIVVNVQGDEPEIDPTLIDRLVETLSSEPWPGGAPMATLASTFTPDEDPADPNIVKVVVSTSGGALYFSRSLIPFDRDRRGHVKPLKHVGLYAYRPEFLLQYVALPPAALELAEQLEQLRALEHGYRIKVVQADVRHHGIDTPAQYAAFVRRCRAPA